jgi:hypothetical protein
MTNELLGNYLSHDLIKEKYNLNDSDISKDIREALNSDKSIVSTIANIINIVQNEPAISDKQLANKISQHLNNAIL